MRACAHRLKDIKVSGLLNGQALWIEGSSTRNTSVTLDGCLLYDNDRTPILVNGLEKGVTLDVRDCNVRNNAGSDGGGIAMEGDSTLLVTDTIFQNNQAEVGGAG